MRPAMTPVGFFSAALSKIDLTGVSSVDGAGAAGSGAAAAAVKLGRGTALNAEVP